MQQKILAGQLVANSDDLHGRCSRNQSLLRNSKREGALLLSQASLLFRCRCSMDSDESAPVFAEIFGHNR